MSPPGPPPVVSAALPCFSAGAAATASVGQFKLGVAAGVAAALCLFLRIVYHFLYQCSVTGNSLRSARSSFIFFAPAASDRDGTCFSTISQSSGGSTRAGGPGLAISPFQRVFNLKV